jgi:hypothetical protein
MTAAMRSAKQWESRPRHISGESPTILNSYRVPTLAVMLRIFRLATPRLAMCSCASASHHAERPSWKMLKLFARGVPAWALVLSATT